MAIFDGPIRKVEGEADEILSIGLSESNIRHKYHNFFLIIILIIKKIEKIQINLSNANA
jgi:hypothetical protein